MEQAPDWLIGILELWGIFIFISILAYLMKKTEEPKKPAEKQCPPHAWKWLEQPGVQGTWYIQCQRCKMFPSVTGRDTP